VKDLENHLEKYSRSNEELQRMLKEQIQSQPPRPLHIETRDRVREEEDRLASARSLESQKHNAGKLDELMNKRLSSIKHRDSGSEAHDLLGQSQAIWEGSKPGDKDNYWKDFLSGESKIKPSEQQKRASIDQHYPYYRESRGGLNTIPITESFNLDSEPVTGIGKTKTPGYRESMPTSAKSPQGLLYNAYNEGSYHHK